MLLPMHTLANSFLATQTWLLAQADTTVNSPTGFFTHNIIYILVVGLVVGVIAKFLTPGRDPGGCIITSLIGIGGALLASFVGSLLGIYGNGVGPGLIGSVVGAILLLVIYHLIVGRRGGGPTV